MKKLTFGTPEKLKPSVFCKGFNYVEKSISYPIAVGESGRDVYLPQGGWRDYFTKEPVESGWHHIETDGILVYERMD